MLFYRCWTLEQDVQSFSIELRNRTRGFAPIQTRTFKIFRPFVPARGSHAEHASTRYRKSGDFHFLKKSTATLDFFLVITGRSSRFYENRTGTLLLIYANSHWFEARPCTPYYPPARADRIPATGKVFPGRIPSWFTVICFPIKHLTHTLWNELNVRCLARGFRLLMRTRHGHLQDQKTLGSRAGI